MSWEPSDQPIQNYRVYRTRQYIAASDAHVLFSGQLADMTWVDIPTNHTEVIDDTKSDQRYYIVVGVGPQGELVSVKNFLILPRMVAQPHNPFSLHTVLGGEKLGATLTARDEKRFEGAKKELEQAEWFKRTDQGQNRNRMLDTAFSAKVTLSMLQQFYPEHLEIRTLAQRANELCTALQQEAPS